MGTRPLDPSGPQTHTGHPRQAGTALLPEPSTGIYVCLWTDAHRPPKCSRVQRRSPLQVAHSHTRVAVTLCQRAQRSLTLSPVPLTCPRGQNRGRMLVGPQLESVLSAMCPAPQPGNIVTTQHTHRSMGRYTRMYHAQTPSAQIHTHVGDGHGHASAGHSHAQTQALPGKAVSGHTSLAHG